MTEFPSFIGWIIFLCVCVCVCVCVCTSHHILCIHSSADTCFHVLAIMDTLQWTWKCKYLFEVLISFPLDIHSEVILLYYIVVLVLNFLRTLHNVFHSGSTNLYSQKWYTSSLFSTSPPILTSCLPDRSHSNRCEAISHCDFHLHLPDD